VPPCDATALAEAVAALVGDPARRARFGVDARAAVEGRGWAAIGDELVGHYVAVHSGGLPAPMRIAA
jgi:phosphatidylinositol alpha 1,6-mannosyltransferase